MVGVVGFVHRREDWLTVHEGGRKARLCVRNLGGRSSDSPVGEAEDPPVHPSGIPRYFATDWRCFAPFFFDIPALRWSSAAAGSECRKNA